jgi:hypothetical protein
MTDRYSRRLQGRGQKGYYWYVVARAVKFVLTFMATAIAQPIDPKKFVSDPNYSGYAPLTWK